MAVRWIPWLLANEFVHIRAFILPLLENEGVPAHLKKRMQKRLKSAKRIVIARTLIYLIMFPALLALLASLVFVAHEEVLASEVVAGLRAVFSVLLRLMSLLFVIAGALLFIVQRALKLLMVDLLMLSMELVALGVHTGGEPPSKQVVHLQKKKDKSDRTE